MKTRVLIATLAIGVVAVACGSKKSSSSGGGGTPLTGIIHEASTSGSNTPLAGATVTAGGKSTTSAADGSYTLLVASNQTLFIHASAASHLTSIQGVVVAPGGSQVNLDLVPDALVQAVASAIGKTYDSGKGVVGVNFQQASGNGNVGAGYGASLSAANDGSFVFNSAGNPVLGSATLTSNNSTVIFVNVATGNTTVTTTAPASHSCSPRYSSITSYPVEAHATTNVDESCN